MNALTMINVCKFFCVSSERRKKMFPIICVFFCVCVIFIRFLECFRHKKNNSFGVRRNVGELMNA